jgi:hypothetical protein
LSRVVALPRTGSPPIPGEGPDPARWVHGPRPDVTGSGSTHGDLSTNWSGEIDTGTTYTAVQGYWTVPTVAPSSTAKYAAAWIGIGGDRNTKLIQTGTTSDTSGGTTSYSAWYELLPAPSIEIHSLVSPGNKMEAFIDETSPGSWTITIEDVTEKWVNTGTFSYTVGTPSSAEWITERPTLITNTKEKLSTLADFGSVRFHDLKTTAVNPAATSLTAIYMVDTRYPDPIIAYPGKVTSPTTNNFTDYFGTLLPTVTSVSPSQGTTAGGTSVTIAGTNFIATTPAESVHFGADAASFGVNADGTITATAPAEPSGTVNVTVTTRDATSAVSSADQFTYTGTTPPPPPSTTSGYDLVGSDGGVFVFPTGSSGGFYGSLPGIGVTPAAPVVGMVPTSDDQGYFLVGSDGGVFSFGNAPYLGSLPGIGVTPAEPITGIVPTGTDHGYFLVGRDGGVYAFGNAPYLGSLPGDGVHVDDVVGIAATPSGNGYWLVASDGTVYAFGAAQELGSAMGTASPVSAIAGTPDGGGYWIVTQNGSVYTFGDARYFDSLPALGVTPALPVIGIVHTAGTAGYWLIGADGGIFAFGDAGFVGSLPGLGVHVTDIVGAVPTTG